MFTNFFQKSCCVSHNVEKYVGAGQATDDKYNRALTFCVLYNKRLHTHTHTHSEICKLLLPTETMVTRTRLNVTLYVHGLSVEKLLYFK